MSVLQEENGKVSVWLGHFDHEAGWEAYLVEQYEDELQPMNAFAAEFGLGFYYDHDMQEVFFSPPGDVLVAELLIENSYADSFREAVAAQARQDGIITANVSLLLYNNVYQPAPLVSNPQSRLHFVGVFSFVML